MVTTRSGSNKKATGPARKLKKETATVSTSKAKKETMAKVAKTKKAKAGRPRKTKTAATAAAAPPPTAQTVPDIRVTRAPSDSRQPSRSPGRSTFAPRTRAPTPHPNVRVRTSPPAPPPTPSAPTPPRTPSTPSPRIPYVPPKRRRSSLTDAQRKRNAVLFYNKLLPVCGEMADTFSQYDGETEMFEVWHLLEQALAKLAQATGHWNLDTMGPGVLLDEVGLPESPRGRRKVKARNGR
ncbi:hypothetical protein LTR85_006005 [Meristemomyces frigidus]|nr:hypothetical protein LTR85_006005 [Meristemomyces frigidus]